MKIVIHGGAGNIPRDSERRRRKEEMILQIAEEGWRRLTQGASALEIAVETVKLLEDEPCFNAGTGSFLQEDGVARLSASVMDSEAQCFSAVVNLEGFLNPIVTAHALQEERTKVLGARGASEFARKSGHRAGDVITEYARQLLEEKLRTRTEGTHGTVGAVVLDSRGRIAAATSTGGRGAERTGRVSDTCMPVGNYASPLCGVSCTGTGEEIMSEGLAVRIVSTVEGGLTLEQALRVAFERAVRNQRFLGAIALDREGNTGLAFTTEAMTYATASDKGLSGGMILQEVGASYRLELG